MDRSSWARKLMNGPLGGPLLSAGGSLLFRDAVRAPLARALDRRLWARAQRAASLEKQRTLIYRAVLHTLDRLLARHTISPHVARVVVERWSRAFFASRERRRAVAAFQEREGCRPPWFLVISPGHACNLSCPGCYASSGAGTAKLAWSTLDRLMGSASFCSTFGTTAPWSRAASRPGGNEGTSMSTGTGT
jgi:hypothetical protein